MGDRGGFTTAGFRERAARMPAGPARDALMAQLGLRPASALPMAAPAAGGVTSLPRPVGNGMNKTEAAFARRLDALVRAGEVKWYAFNVLRLRLADRIQGGRTLWYKIDFVVVLPGGGIELIEVKGGHITEGGMLRFRTAAEQHPGFQFKLWQKLRGQDWRCIRSTDRAPADN